MTASFAALMGLMLSALLAAASSTGMGDSAPAGAPPIRLGVRMLHLGSVAALAFAAWICSVAVAAWPGIVIAIGLALLGGPLLYQALPASSWMSARGRLAVALFNLLSAMAVIALARN